MMDWDARLGADARSGMTRQGVGQAIPVEQMTKLITFADVEEVFKSKDFVQAGGGRRDSAPVYGDTLLSLSGNDHFYRRRFESALFRKAPLNYYENQVLIPAIERVIRAHVSRNSPDGVPRADVLSLAKRILLHVSVAIVGFDGADLEDSFERLFSYIGKLSEGANVEWSTRDHREVIREALEAKRPFIAEFFVPSFDRRSALIAAYHAGELQETQLPFDLLTLLLQHRDHFQKWPPEVFANEATLFTVANVGSPANAIAHILAELLGWLADHPEDRRRVEDPGFLRSAANEALRLHPASPYVVRQAVQDTVLSSGRAIRAGEYVTLHFTPANRDPAVFGPHPDRFDLDRQTLSSAKAAGLSFGAGPHTCIGRFLTIGDPRSEADAAVGTAVRILLELFRRGVRLDPDAPPCLRTDNTRNEYAAFPVLLTKM